MWVSAAYRASAACLCFWWKASVSALACYRGRGEDKCQEKMVDEWVHRKRPRPKMMQETTEGGGELFNL